MFRSDAKMTRLGLSPRVPLGTWAYVFAALSVIGGAFVATIALTPIEAVTKIGPGYARMQPVYLGKPEKVVYSPPYYPRVAAPRVSRISQPAPSSIAAKATTPAAPRIMIVEAAQSSYSRPDIHRVY
jgi:hypothetical protein